MNRYLAIFPCLLLCLTTPLFAQSNAGELRLKVTDPSGLGVKSSVELVSEANRLRLTMITDDAGNLVARNLPFGIYRLQVQREGFALFSEAVEVRSAIPAEFNVKLSVAAVNAAVTVNAAATLIDPQSTGTINRVDSDALAYGSTPMPGRAMSDLVNSQPGWLLEANGVLHPRGSENQTQFVIDGVPLTDSRSLSFAPEAGSEDVESMTILTANFPAEYGRKLGGVVEVATDRNFRTGLHGVAQAYGSSFATAGGSLRAQYGWKRNLWGMSADGARTDRYLDPPVLANYTNRATTSDFAASYSRDFSDADRLDLAVRRGQARFLVPNENIQQAAGQRQDRDTYETVGTLSYQHIFSPNLLADLQAMGRDLSADLSSNAFATPIQAAQDRGFREGYFKGSLAAHHGIHEWKTGVEADFASLHEQFGYVLTDPSQFDPGTPPVFNFAGRGQDREQAAFLQDRMAVGRWTLSLGVRWDHYHLLLDQNAVSPRLGLARYWARAGLVLHASYDRAFQTPASENLLLSSSPQIIALNPQVLRLLVRPSLGNFYQAGFTKGLWGAIKLDANYFRRDFSNYADDDVLLNTGISFPIAFSRAHIYGAESKLDVPKWGRLSGYLSYSYMVGTGYFPVTGGLFLGDDATHVLNSSGGRFPVSQDQRNTVRTRFRYQFVPRLWAALGAESGSGLPTEFTGIPQQVIDQYGQAVLDRVNLARGRVRPSFSVDASLGTELWKKDNFAVRLQVDAQNLNNRINLINFAGLFSGTALAPPRSYAVRLETSF